MMWTTIDINIHIIDNWGNQHTLNSVAANELEPETWSSLPLGQDELDIPSPERSGKDHTFRDVGVNT